MDVTALRLGEDYAGPALIEQPGSTVVIGPGDRFRLDEHANLRITLGAKQGHSA
jgi:N-methylhydantoinase A